MINNQFDQEKIKNLKTHHFLAVISIEIKAN